MWNKYLSTEARIGGNQRENICPSSPCCQEHVAPSLLSSYSHILHPPSHRVTIQWFYCIFLLSSCSRYISYNHPSCIAYFYDEYVTFTQAGQAIVGWVVCILFLFCVCFVSKCEEIWNLETPLKPPLVPPPLSLLLIKAFSKRICTPRGRFKSNALRF